MRHRDLDCVRSDKDGDAASQIKKHGDRCRDMCSIFAIEGRCAQNADIWLAPRQRTLIDQSAGERRVALCCGLQATTALQQALELQSYRTSSPRLRKHAQRLSQSRTVLDEQVAETMRGQCGIQLTWTVDQHWNAHREAVRDERQFPLCTREKAEIGALCGRGDGQPRIRKMLAFRRRSRVAYFE